MNSLEQYLLHGFTVQCIWKVNDDITNLITYVSEGQMRLDTFSSPPKVSNLYLKAFLGVEPHLPIGCS